jgi:signal recognition particle GTPase
MACVGKLFKALKRTRETISDAFDIVRKQKVSIESLDELEETLILADIGFEIVEKILDVIKKNKQDNFIADVEKYLISILPKNENDKVYTSMPNVIFMVITRDSIKGAFNLGIQAQQILRFLEKHGKYIS